VIDHVSITVRDLAASADFYRAVLEPLGLEQLVRREGTVGFGKQYPEFWLNLRPVSGQQPTDSGHHVCLRARDREAVEAFHRVALANGGKDDGAPGEREAAVTTYYGAFFRDPDGNRIEAVTFPRT
jgi:catechol 2,3-dioxygenase-like lactoylglutathione lyase family enzyme